MRVFVRIGRWLWNGANLATWSHLFHQINVWDATNLNIPVPMMRETMSEGVTINHRSPYTTSSLNPCISNACMKTTSWWRHTLWSLNVLHVTVPTSVFSWSMMMTVQCSHGISSCASVIILLIMAFKLAVSSNRPLARSRSTCPAQERRWNSEEVHKANFESAGEEECVVQELSVEQTNGTESHEQLKLLVWKKAVVLNTVSGDVDKLSEDFSIIATFSSSLLNAPPSFLLITWATPITCFLNQCSCLL